MADANELAPPPARPWTGPDLTRTPLAIAVFSTLLILGAVAIVLHTPAEFPRLARQSAIWAIIVSVFMTTVGAVQHGASRRVIIRALVIYAVIFFTMRVAIEGFFVATERYLPAHIPSTIVVAVVVMVLGAVLVATVREVWRASRQS